MHDLLFSFPVPILPKHFLLLHWKLPGKLSSGHLPLQPNRQRVTILLTLLIFLPDLHFKQPMQSVPVRILHISLCKWQFLCKCLCFRPVFKRKYLLKLLNQLYKLCFFNNMPSVCYLHFPLKRKMRIKLHTRFSFPTEIFHIYKRQSINFRLLKLQYPLFQLR